MYVKYGNEYADICHISGLTEEENAVRSHVDDMYKLFLMQAGMVNGSFVHMMPKAVRLVHMNVKMDRYTLNHRAS
ncbi:MAG: hypothetical protein ACLR7D_02965 [Lachnospira eligens]